MQKIWCAPNGMFLPLFPSAATHRMSFWTSDLVFIFILGRRCPPTALCSLHSQKGYLCRGPAWKCDLGWLSSSAWKKMGKKWTPGRKWLRVKGQRNALGVLQDASEELLLLLDPAVLTALCTSWGSTCKTVAAFLCLGWTQFDRRIFHRTTETEVVRLYSFGNVAVAFPFLLSLQPLPCKRVSEMFSDWEYLISWFPVWVLAFIKRSWNNEEFLLSQILSVVYGCDGEKGMLEMWSGCTMYLLKLFTDRHLFFWCEDWFFQLVFGNWATETCVY